ncbi:MAG: ATP-grasp domain-containing protein, partial [bacterium]|nr:ATP-grasp domain-containing protein [bacterium]
MNNIYWVGVRQSDIEDTGNLFKGSITIFGDNKDGNIAYCNEDRRINHNIEDEECNLFFEKTLNSLCQKDKSVRFMFYNPEMAYKNNDFIKQRTICLNKYELLLAFSDKQRSRFIVRDVANIIPFVILNGCDCNYDNIKNYFRDCDEFVIQKIFSAGGEGTRHIDSEYSVDYFIQKNEKYIVSPYIKDATPLNVHIVIFENEILYLPPSIQVITEIENRPLYCGADFICFEMLQENTKELIKEKSIHIGEIARSKGYRGVLGIDFLLKDEQLFFLEFNARFQASSQLINKALYNHCGLSLQKINLYAFFNLSAPKISPFYVKYSNYTYTSSNITKTRLKRIVCSDEINIVQHDGYFNYEK